MRGYTRPMRDGWQVCNPSIKACQIGMCRLHTIQRYVFRISVVQYAVKFFGHSPRISAPFSLSIACSAVARCLVAQSWRWPDVYNERILGILSGTNSKY